MFEAEGDKKVYPECPMRSKKDTPYYIMGLDNLD